MQKHGGLVEKAIEHLILKYPLRYCFKWLVKRSFIWARKVLKLSFFGCTEPVHSLCKFVIFKEPYPVLILKISPINHSLFCVGVMGLSTLKK